MSDYQVQDAATGSGLDELVARYLQAEAEGSPVRREALLAENPELADEILAFFRSHDAMLGLAGPPSTPRPAGDTSRRGSADASTYIGPVSRFGDDASAAAGPDGPVDAAFGDYELLEELGRGGMGVVFRARQRSLNRIVALKMILANRLAGREDVQRFYGEAETAARLQHRGIVQIFEVGRHEGQHYFSMECVEGLNLGGLVSGEEVLPPGSAAEIVRRVAVAVAYAHERGVIHRDLKPANVLLARSTDSSGIPLSTAAGTGLYEPKVADFGLAKRTEGDSGVTGTGQIVGTPSYMPPEQAAGRNGGIGPAADVYSLGAVLYALLTGRPPFRAADVMETLRQVVEDEPVSPGRLNPAIPRDLETICLKCLRKAPADRYAGAAALAEDLRRFLADEPILARPAGRAERLRKWVRRRPASAALLIATVVASIASVALAVGTPLLLRLQDANDEISEKRDQAQYQLERANKYLYRFSIDRADRYWREGQRGAAIEMLTGVLVEQRDWEWYFLYRRFHEDRTGDAPIRTVQTHGKAVLGVRFAGSAGDAVTSLHADGTARVHGLAPSRPPTVLTSFAPTVDCFAIAPQGTRVAAATSETGRGGRSGSTLSVWDAGSRRELWRRPETRTATAMALSPDGNRVFAAFRNSEAALWSLGGPQEPLLIPDAGLIQAVVFSDDGGRIAGIASGRESDVDEAVVWKAGDGEEVCRIPVDDSASVIAFSPEGRLLVGVGSDITIWDVNSGQWISDLKGHAAPVRTLAFGANEARLASGSDDGAIKIWDWASHRTISVLLPDPTLQLPSKRQWGGVLNEALLTLDAGADGRGPAAALAWDPAGEKLVSGHADGTLQVWNGVPQFRVPRRRPSRFDSPLH